MNNQQARTELAALAARRWRVAVTLTATILATYFGFVLLVAWAKPMLGTVITPGLSLGILLGALVIVVAWLLTGIYIRWANRHYDPVLAKLRAALRSPEASPDASPDGGSAADRQGGA